MSNNRLLALNNAIADTTSECVLYVMSRDQRVADNHALLLAQQDAIRRKLPLLVVFNLLPRTGYRIKQQYDFMLDGLEEVTKQLKVHNIGFDLLIGDAKKNVIDYASGKKAGAIYFDLSPLRGVRLMQKAVASEVEIPTFVVDTHNIIPLWVLSDKEEFAAHTIRNKVHKHLADWLVEPDKIQSHPIDPPRIDDVDWHQARAAVAAESPEPSPVYDVVSGESAAHEALNNFIHTKLEGYATLRNDPSVDGQSNLSPYIHFGQLSALRIALDIIAVAPSAPLLLEEARLASFDGEPTKMDSINALLEELIVRKELADNYCFYNSHYDSLEGARDWARDSLAEHENDKREYIYTQQQLENAATHDATWNAAQSQMMQSGKMHGYMRMYWAKKILEWSDTPQEAITKTVYLNDTYSLDGGDPNGYTGIMWSIAGVHDRPWFEREVFGKIRYMNEAGLRRKFDIDSYIKRWTR